MASNVPGGAYRQAAPQQQLVPAAPPIAICGACGVGAPARGTTCEACGARLEETRRQVPPAPPVVWAAVRATFTCRSCAFHSPLDGVETDQGVHCAQCGAFQKFEADGWQASLMFAHGVADLAGPTPEGLFPSPRIWIGDQNPHAHLGVTATFARSGGGTGATGGALPEVEVGRGFPTCEACKLPLDVSLGAGGVETRCRGCGASARFELPAQVARWAPSVRAIVAAEQRVDQRRCRLQQQAGGGMIALLCPQCGAPLRDVRAGSVRCEHCQTLAFVPARARPRDGGGILQASPFFVAFDGPSFERAQLQKPRLPEEDPGLAALAKLKGKAGVDAEALVAAAKKKNQKTGLFGRGLDPLAGVDLPERRPGLDVRQLSLSLLLTGLALAVGFVLVAFYNHVLRDLF